MGTPWFYKMDDHGETPMSRAKRCGYRALAEVLIRQEQRQHNDPVESATQLHRAAYWGLSNAVAKLLDEGASPGTRDEIGDTPLVTAARNGHLETMEALIEHGADPNETDADGLTPLHWVAMNGRRDLAMVLLDANSDVNVREQQTGGLTPMGIALLMGYDDLVELLSVHGGTF